MRRFNVNFLPILLVLSLLAACAVYEVSFNLGYSPEELFNGVYVVRTQMSYDSGFKNPPVLGGAGFCLGNGLFVTVRHNVWKDELSTFFPSPDGFAVLFSGNPSGAESWVEVGADKKVKLDLIVENNVWDLALLRSEAPLGLFPIKLGDSDRIVVGTKVFLIGNARSLYRDIRPGVVTSLRGPNIERDEYFKGRDPDAFFSVNCGLVAGDSGSPILAFRNGELEIIGIAVATLESENIGWAVKVNYLKKLLKEFES